MSAGGGLVAGLIEIRRSASPVAVRSSERRTIGGYAAVFNRNSENLGGFVEQVNPGAFNKSAGDGWPKVIARFNHSDDFLLGTTAARTLRLSKDNRGLLYEVDLPQCRNDVYEMVSRGDVANSSFAFQAYEDDWSHDGSGNPIRTLLSAKLIDVAPVTTPAYPDATVGLRSLARHMDAPIEDVMALAARNDLRKFMIRTDSTSPRSHRVRSGLSGRDALATIMSRRPTAARERLIDLHARRWTSG